MKPIRPGYIWKLNDIYVFIEKVGETACSFTVVLGQIGLRKTLFALLIMIV